MTRCNPRGSRSSKWRRWAARAGWCRRTASRRGQSLVEFSLALPLFILLLTSVAEFGLLYKDYMVINYAAREGARVGAAAGSDVTADTSITNAVRRATATLDRTRIQEVRIFESDAAGVQVGSNASIYVWNAGSNAFVLSGSAGWPPGNRDDTATPDRIGIRILYNHFWVTGAWFGGSLVLADTVIMRIEPKSTV